jgi:hypothetical protein
VFEVSILHMLTIFLLDFGTILRIVFLFAILLQGYILRSSYYNTSIKSGGIKPNIWAILPS